MNVIPPLYSRVLLLPLNVVETLQAEVDRLIVGFQGWVIIVSLLPYWPVVGDA